MHSLVKCLGAVLFAAGLCSAGTVTSLHVELGSWNGSSFSPNGSDWNTYNTNNWAIGATAPGYNNPLLDSFNNVNLPDGDYWLYMADNGDYSARAVRITLGYSSGSVAEIFTSPGGAVQTGPYTLVSGTGFTASFISGPETTYTPVSQNQHYFSTGAADWVVEINSGTATPEPGSWFLLVPGLAVLAVARRKLVA